MSDDILTMLAEKEAALVGELEKVRAARAAFDMVGTPKKKTHGLKNPVPRVQLTSANDDDDASGGSLPAPRRSMSRAARKKLSDNMKARWKKLKASQKS